MWQFAFTARLWLAALIGVGLRHCAVPAFQRRGLYTALVERHVVTALAAGARLLTVDANENSRPVLERVGFSPLVGVQGYLWQPPN